MCGWFGKISFCNFNVVFTSTYVSLKYYTCMCMWSSLVAVCVIMQCVCTWVTSSTMCYINDPPMDFLLFVIFLLFFFINRESPSVLSRPPLQRLKSGDVIVTQSPKSKQPQARISSDTSDIHICVLCLKALMNNAVSRMVWEEFV